MIKAVAIFALVACTLARPEAHVSDEDLAAELGLFPSEGTFHFRQVANPTTPNQVTDALLVCVKSNLAKRGWCTSKRVQNGESTIPFDVNNGGDSSSETFGITNARVTGLCNIKRSKSASFNNDKSVLTTTLAVEDMCLEADYTVTFPGIGEAPSETRSGVVTEKVIKMFADMQLNVQDLKAQGIKSYSVRAGHDELEQVSNMDGNMQSLHLAGFRKSSRQTLEDTMTKNMKVVINQAIQECKA
ncbi:unnamed protein product [Meganyctiphanes norvegica]|uniref:Uncharacterized protein n=1 Tax=Meganyctiphanes norvegica TaxID=48144 RepID=A0AAV2S336_MEGNR